MGPVRLATPADLPAVREVVSAAYARYLDRMDRPPAPMLADYAAEVESGLLWVTGEPVTGLIELTVRGDRLDLFTNEVMTENQAIYARLGYRETGRRTEDGYQRVYMEKDLG
jgi:hypothetical protein